MKHALARFIEEQMTNHGWKEQKELSEASGVPRSTLSQILDEDRPLQRPPNARTMGRLAAAFAAKDHPPGEQRDAAARTYERAMNLKVAEALGVPGGSPVIEVTPSDDYILARVTRALDLLRRIEEGDGQQPVSTPDPSEADVVPNTEGADEEVGGQGSGELRRTVGDPQIPVRPQSRGSDSDAPERRATERTAPPPIRSLD